MNKNYFASITPIKTIKTFCFLLVAFLISISSYSQKGTFTSSGTLEVPAGVGVVIGGVVPNPLTAKCWAAGGGGGGSNLLTAAGGGGGGGAFKSSTVTLVANKNNVAVSYTVGAGGAGGTSANINGSAGGFTSFPSSVSPVFSYTAITANGGSGGVGGTSLIAYGSGGAGGTAGDYKGGNGASGDSILFVGLVSGGGGGGAGSGGSGSNGNNGALNQAGGTGGSGNGGAGGSGVLLLGNGSNASILGVGGGGGGGAGLLSPLSATATGGNGANGRIEVSYTCPTYSVTSASSTSACNTFGTATITLTSSAAGLPIGTYTVTYDRTVPLATGLPATMVVETAGTGTFTAEGLITAGTSRITIKKLTSVDCVTDVSASNKYADLTVSTVPVQPGIISGYTNQCVGNATQTYSVATVATATSYIWTVDAASGWSITSGQNSNSITVTVGAASANVSVVAVNSCGNSTASTLVVNLNLPAPTASVTLQPTCAVNTGTITITAPATGTGMSYSINGVDYSNTTGIFTLIPIGSYNVTARYPSGCVSNVAVTLMQSSVVTRIWDDGAWDVVPTIENKVIFATSYNKDESVEACSCEVESGADVTFKTGRYLKIRNELKVNPAGSLTFENNASLVQISDDPSIVIKSSGEISYKRYTKPVKRYDFTYWSSPVEGQTLKKLSPNTLGDKYYSYIPDSGWKIWYNGAKEMIHGEGYIIRAPQTFSITAAAIDDTPVFIGKPNNGVITLLSLAGNKAYLLGNPYPSAIDADEFLKVNSDLNVAENLRVLEGTLYFWTHNSPPSSAVGTFPGNDTAKYNYTTNDYATYNRTGGVGTRAAINDDDLNDPDDNFNDTVPTGEIAAGQGFFAPTKATGNVVFNNSMRLLSDAVMDNSQFFKLGTTSKSTSGVEKNRVWLNFSNAEGAFKQTLIGYITGATNEYEGSFDGVSYDGNQYVDFYSVNQGANLSIQGRALPFQEKDSVALGYKSAIKGDFKISIDHADGTLTTQKVFLEDKVTQVLHDLKVAYSFTTEKGVFNDRFVLRYVDKNALIIDAVDVPVEGVLVSTTDKNIKITTTGAVINEVYIYNFSGGLVYSDTVVNTTATSISNLLVDYGGLIVQVVLENGKKAVKKIIY